MSFAISIGNGKAWEYSLRGFVFSHTSGVISDEEVAVHYEFSHPVLPPPLFNVHFSLHESVNQLEDTT